MSPEDAAAEHANLCGRLLAISDPARRAREARLTRGERARLRRHFNGLGSFDPAAEELEAALRTSAEKIEIGLRRRG